MKTPNRIWLVPVAIILVFVIIACSSGSLKPSSSGTTSTPAISSSGSQSTQAVTAPETPVVTVPASGAKVSSGPAEIGQVTAQVKIPAGENGSGIAACPEGSLTLGGGFASDKGIQITKSMPDPTGWLVAGMNATGNALSLGVYAVCLKNASGTTHIVSADEPVSGGPFARCQKGELITGGGFADNTGSLDVYISTPIGDSVDPNNAWSVMARSSQNADQPITVYAVCLAGSGLTSTLARDEKVNYGPGGSSLSFSIACPTGSQMVSGGYEGTGVYVNRINPTDAGLWEVQVQGKDFFDGSLDHAVCLSIK